MLSFWEKQHFLHYNYIIIGSGITGLSAACSIKEKNPKASVLVLERGLLPTGASTKNAGFACIGSLSEKISDLKLMGEEKLVKLIEDRWNGLFMLRKRLGDDHIDYQNNGGFELILQRDDIDEDQMNSMNKLLLPIFKNNVFSLKPELIPFFRFNKEMVKQIVYNPYEGQINTGLMMSSLATYAGILQIRIITGADVMHINEHPDKVEVVCGVPGDKSEQLQFSCDQALVCTNAFTKRFFPNMEINPGRGQVLSTSPIEGLKIIGTFSFNEGYYYFRNIDNRIILGGGRNLDFETETTTEFELNNTIQKQLEFYLEEMILPGQSYTIEQRWSGIMAFGKDKLPVVQRMSDRIVVGARLNGMGVALGSKIGDELSTLVLR